MSISKKPGCLYSQSKQTLTRIWLFNKETGLVVSMPLRWQRAFSPLRLMVAGLAVFVSANIYSPRVKSKTKKSSIFLIRGPGVFRIGSRKVSKCLSTPWQRLWYLSSLSVFFA